MARLLTNAFSLNMVRDFPCRVEVVEVTDREAQVLAEFFTSAVGHGDTAAVFASVLGREVAFNRATVSLASGDELLVGQYRGPRLPEGCKALPPGATIQWLRVTVG